MLTNRLPLSSALIVGDPAYWDSEFGLPQLPGARTEAKAIGRLLSSPALIGDKATLQAVSTRAAVSGLVYFATHGVSYSTSGLEGFIALANGDRLTAAAVQKTCLRRTRLAVLSACQTGLGQSEAGGIIGLARGFQIAGVPEVLMSLWNVDDAATKMLMTEALLWTKTGVPPAEALRRSMKAVRDAYPSPKFWSGFAVFSELMD